MKYIKRAIVFVAVVGFILFNFATVRTVDIDTAISNYQNSGIDELRNVQASDLVIQQSPPFTNYLEPDKLTIIENPVDSDGKDITNEKPIQEQDLVALLFEQKEQLPNELKLNFSKTKTYQDGTTKTEPTSGLTLSLNRPLDFLVVSDDPTPITNGKITIFLEEFSQGFQDSNLVVDYFINDIFKETITTKIQQKGTVIKTIEDKDLFGTQEEGTKKIKLVARELYIVTPSGNFFLPASTTIYEAEFTKSTSQTIIKNEKGEFVKVYDTDIPFTFTGVSQQAGFKQCINYLSGGGCLQWTSVVYYYPIESISGILTDSEGNIIASGSSGRPPCSRYYQNGFGPPCLDSPSVTVISTKLQRGETYFFKPITPFSATIKIVVPTDKNISYYYWASNKASNFNS